MAPKHWNKSHLLTILLRCGIATWSSIFLKTTEIHQKSAVRRQQHHFQQKCCSDPQPVFPGHGPLHCPLISRGAAPGRCSGRAMMLSSCIHPRPCHPAGSLHRGWPGDSSRAHGNRSQAPPGQRFEKRERQKLPAAAAVLKEPPRADLVQEPWNPMEKSFRKTTPRQPVKLSGCLSVQHGRDTRRGRAEKSKAPLLSQVSSRYQMVEEKRKYQLTVTRYFIGFN